MLNLLMIKSYCGYISILGKPNVGKSTIINHLLKKKVSITSRKSQTTRNNILGVKTDKNKQMIFVDSPGMHSKSPKIMNKILNKTASGLIEESDLVLFVMQRLQFTKEDNFILDKLKSTQAKVICVINKIDQVDDKNKLLPLLDQLSNNYNFLQIIPISAINDNGIQELEDIIKVNLPENPHLYGKNFSNEENNDHFMISELIREKIIRILGDELPHDTFVKLDFLEKEDSIIKIHASIFVVRESQKQIVIGSGGSVLKKIGEQARKDLEKYFEKKIFLKTWVKVKKNWNTDLNYIQSLGVGSNHESN